MNEKVNRTIFSSGFKIFLERSLVMRYDEELNSFFDIAGRLVLIPSLPNNFEDFFLENIASAEKILTEFRARHTNGTIDANTANIESQDANELSNDAKINILKDQKLNLSEDSLPSRSSNVNITEMPIYLRVSQLLINGGLNIQERNSDKSMSRSRIRSNNILSIQKITHKPSSFQHNGEEMDNIIRIQENSIGSGSILDIDNNQSFVLNRVSRKNLSNVMDLLKTGNHEYRHNKSISNLFIDRDREFIDNKYPQFAFGCDRITKSDHSSLEKSQVVKQNLKQDTKNQDEFSKTETLNNSAQGSQVNNIIINIQNEKISGQKSRRTSQASINLDSNNKLPKSRIDRKKRINSFMHIQKSTGDTNLFPQRSFQEIQKRKSSVLANDDDFLKNLELFKTEGTKFQQKLSHQGNLNGFTALEKQTASLEIIKEEKLENEIVNELPEAGINETNISEANIQNSFIEKDNQDLSDEHQINNKGNLSNLHDEIQPNMIRADITNNELTTNLIQRNHNIQNGTVPELLQEDKIIKNENQNAKDQIIEKQSSFVEEKLEELNLKKKISKGSLGSFTKLNRLSTLQKVNQDLHLQIQPSDTPNIDQNIVSVKNFGKHNENNNIVAEIENLTPEQNVLIAGDVVSNNNNVNNLIDDLKNESKIWPPIKSISHIDQRDEMLVITPNEGTLDQKTEIQRDLKNEEQNAINEQIPDNSKFTDSKIEIKDLIPQNQTIYEQNTQILSKDSRNEQSSFIDNYANKSNLGKSPIPQKEKKMEVFDSQLEGKNSSKSKIEEVVSENKQIIAQNQIPCENIGGIEDLITENKPILPQNPNSSEINLKIAIPVIAQGLDVTMSKVQSVDSPEELLNSDITSSNLKNNTTKQQNINPIRDVIQDQQPAPNVKIESPLSAISNENHFINTVRENLNKEVENDWISETQIAKTPVDKLVIIREEEDILQYSVIPTVLEDGTNQSSSKLQVQFAKKSQTSLSQNYFRPNKIEAGPDQKSQIQDPYTIEYQQASINNIKSEIVNNPDDNHNLSKNNVSCFQTKEPNQINNSRILENHKSDDRGKNKNVQDAYPDFQRDYKLPEPSSDPRFVNDEILKETNYVNDLQPIESVMVHEINKNIQNDLIEDIQEEKQARRKIATVKVKKEVGDKIQKLSTDQKFMQNSKFKIGQNEPLGQSKFTEILQNRTNELQSISNKRPSISKDKLSKKDSEKHVESRVLPKIGSSKISSNINSRTNSIKTVGANPVNSAIENVDENDGKYKQIKPVLNSQQNLSSVHLKPPKLQIKKDPKSPMQPIDNKFLIFNNNVGKLPLSPSKSNIEYAQFKEKKTPSHIHQFNSERRKFKTPEKEQMTGKHTSSTSKAEKQSDRKMNSNKRSYFSAISNKDNNSNQKDGTNFGTKTIKKNRYNEQKNLSKSREISNAKNNQLQINFVEKPRNFKIKDGARVLNSIQIPNVTTKGPGFNRSKTPVQKNNTSQNNISVNVVSKNPNDMNVNIHLTLFLGSQINATTSNKNSKVLRSFKQRNDVFSKLPLIQNHYGHNEIGKEKGAESRIITKANISDHKVTSLVNKKAQKENVSSRKLTYRGNEGRLESFRKNPNINIQTGKKSESMDTTERNLFAQFANLKMGPKESTKPNRPDLRFQETGDSFFALKKNNNHRLQTFKIVREATQNSYKMPSAHILSANKLTLNQRKVKEFISPYGLDYSNNFLKQHFDMEIQLIGDKSKTKSQNRMPTKFKIVRKHTHTNKLHS